MSSKTHEHVVMPPGTLRKGKLEQLYRVGLDRYHFNIYVFNFSFMPSYCVCVFCNFLLAKKELQVARGDNYREYSEKTGFILL